MNADSPYRAAGTFAGPAYVEREADVLLRAAIVRNDRIPYVFAARQSGKSSLLQRTCASLEPTRFRCAFADVSTLDLDTYDSLWRGILDEVARTAGLPPAEVVPDHPEDALLTWIRSQPAHLVVCLDEVDALVGVGFRDQFFSKLRSLFNLRAQEAEFERVVLVLAGATSPARLIADPRRSPFNVGIEIRLDDLTPSRTAELVAHLGRTGATIGPDVTAGLHDWTRGSVYLEQLILEALWEVGQSGGSIRSADVDAAAMAIVARAAREIHFQNIYRLLTEREILLDALDELRAGRTIVPGAAQDLRLTGLSDGASPYRNRIYALVFGPGGPLSLCREADPRSPPPSPVPASAPTVPPALVELIDELFCSEAAEYGPYTQSDDPPEVVIPDILYRFVLIDAEQQRVGLQLYRGLASVGGALWTREVRALTRVSWRQHPALPTVLGGAYVERVDLAFVITTAARHHLSEPGAQAFIARDRGEAFRQLTLLAQGLGVLHEQGITHRNLHPGAIEYIHGGEDDPQRYSLRIARFEMSAMVSNLTRRNLPGELLGHHLRRLYLDSDGAALALVYCPPERAAWLFDDTVAQPETDRADVYALGVLAWHWLVRRWDEQPSWLAPERSQAWVRRINQHMRASLEDRPDVPRVLAALLRKMLAPEPRDRPSIFEVLQALAQDYGRIAAGLGSADDVGTLFIGFMPEQSETTIYRWGWIDQDPRDPAGREALRGFLEQELGSAELLYSADGCSAYLTGQNKREQEALRTARYVLVGKQAYWFCDIYREPGRDAHTRSVEQLLLIRYVIQHQRAWHLASAPLRRPVPGLLRFVPVWADRILDLGVVRGEGSSWRPLLESVRHDRSTPAWMQEMEAALAFLLAFRRAELAARLFPYELIESHGGASVDLVRDVKRDRKHQFSDTIRSAYFDAFRPAMGRLFESLDGERSVQFSVLPDQRGRPDFAAGSVARLLFDRRLDDDTVRMRAPHGTRGLPERGWIRPDDDHGNYIQLQRQVDAVQQLLHARTLLHQLHHPAAIRGFRTRWQHAGAGLAGRSRHVVQDMLSCEPFYALHGPPGSGKTTVASTAVAAYLQQEPGQRVLVSSQSHNALDNLGVRMLDLCDREVVAVRIVSQAALADEKVHPRMAALLPEKQAGDMVSRIQHTCARAQEAGMLDSGRPLTEPLRDVLREWAEHAPRVELELRDRIRRGANLVFATTGACTERDVAAASASGMYDWVIVEEAARAWPTELAQPLVRGLRWTLIGDHHQLPAFDDIAVQRFLEVCNRSDHEELRAHGDRAEAYRGVFRLFGSLFDGRARRRKAGSQRLAEPLDELDLQFRMHPDICRIVARSFYRERVHPDTGETTRDEDGWLKTHPSARRAHPLRLPRALRGRAVIWIDTANVPDSADLRAWRNPGEAEVIARLLTEMDPTPRPGDEGFALLTPYNDQIAELRRADLPSWVDSRIYTTDGFQGREADIVVVSLVRSVQRDARRPEANIGHLVSPNRVNVLLSRARTLLIVVGRFDHFTQQARLDRDRTDLRFWRTVTDEFRHQDCVVDAVDILGEDGVW